MKWITYEMTWLKSPNISLYWYFNISKLFLCRVLDNFLLLFSVCLLVALRMGKHHWVCKRVLLLTEHNFQPLICILQGSLSLSQSIFLFSFKLKIDCFLMQCFVIRVFPSSTPHLLFILDLLPFSLSLEKYRLLRDNNKTWQNKIQWSEAKTVIPTLDMATQMVEKVPRTGKRIRDPLILRVRNHIKLTIIYTL